MLISAVEAKRAENSRVSPWNNRAGEADAFARMLDASVEKGNTPSDKSERVALAADILRLELMRSAVSITSGTPETAKAPINNTLHAFLTNYGANCQKADTPDPDSPLQEEQIISQLDFSQPLAAEYSPKKSQSPTSFENIIKTASRRFGVDEGLIKAVIRQESNFNPAAVSRAGARGLMQLMPGTAAGLGVKDSFDPEQNIMAGTRFLKDMLNRYNGDVDSALAAYNWGPGNLDRSRGAFLPRETREYLVKVKQYYAQYVG
jgi:soluble lytic murein transglycosylase-like protein